MNKRSYKEKSLKRIKGKIFLQLNLQPTDEFSLYSAYSAIFPIHDKPEYLKRSKQITFKLYPTRIEMKSSSWLNNENKKNLEFDLIRKFYVFKSMRDFLILGVERDINSKYLLTLVIPNVSHLLMVCDNIEKQCGLRYVCLEPHNPIINENANTVITEETSYFGREDKGVQVKEQFEYNHNEKSTHNAIKHYICNDSPPVERIKKCEPKWHEDVKFISYNSRYGNFVDEGGSVYMYTAQQLTPYAKNDEDYNIYQVSNSSISSRLDLENFHFAQPRRF